MELRKYDKLLLFLFTITPIIDIVNGIVLNNNSLSNIPIGQISRIIIILILFSILIKERYFLEDKKNAIILMLGAFILIMGVQFFQHKQIIGMIQETIVISKFLLIVIIVEVVSFLNTKKLFSSYIIDKSFYYMSIIVPITLIIPYIFNVGTNVYSNGGGYKGFYYANNDLSIVLIVLFIYCLHNAIFGEKRKKFIILTMLVLISNIMIGSKTNLLIPLPISIFYLIFAIKNKKIAIDNKLLIKTLIFIIIGFVICIFSFKEILYKTLERQIHFMKDLDFISFLLSNRNYYLNVALDELINSCNILSNIIFGSGFYFRQLEWGRGLLIEMDFFDTFFSYGALGVLVIYGYILKVFYIGCKKYSIKQLLYIIAFIAVFFFSFTAGHVLFSALSGTIFALICAKLKIGK